MAEPLDAELRLRVVGAAREGMPCRVSAARLLEPFHI